MHISNFFNLKSKKTQTIQIDELFQPNHDKKQNFFLEQLTLEADL